MCRFGNKKVGVFWLNNFYSEK